jgi:hypothetical protein
MKLEQPSFAVLIDADGGTLKSIAPILTDISRRGRILVRRIYGDFTSPQLAGWRDLLAEHAIQPIQQYASSTGRSTSDSALIIDAMDLLHTRRFNGFCLVSGNSDFTRLATRLREDGLMVFGFGSKQVPGTFISACDRFVHVEDLIASPLDVAAANSPLHDAHPLPLGTGQRAAEPVSPYTAATSTAHAPMTRGEALRRSVQLATMPSGWAPITAIGQQLKALGWTIKDSGHATLTDALKAESGLEMQVNGSARYFRAKD